MNAFDIITIIVLLGAVFNGWRNGFIIQCFSLAGIVVGIILASRFGTQVGEFMKLDPQFTTLVGFIAIFVATVVVSGLIAKVLRKLFSAVGLGSLDIWLGIALAIVKFTLILSVVFCKFDSLNKEAELVNTKYIEESRTFRPISSLSEPVLVWLHNSFKTYAK